MVATAVGVLDILFETLANSQKTVDQINQACAAKGLPPAFSMDENGNPAIPGNPDYQFEGFGVIIFLPQLAFWVHYKPGGPQHVALGRFTVPIGFGKLLDLKHLLGQ